MPKRQRGLDVLRDFSLEELVEANKLTEESYNLTHEAMTVMKEAGAHVDGFHRRLNAIARERRCYLLVLKRRIVREGGAEINGRLIHELKPNTGQFIGLQSELGFPGRWPTKLIDQFGRIWVYARTATDGDVSFYTPDGKETGKYGLRIMTELGVQRMEEWLNTFSLRRQKI